MYKSAISNMYSKKLAKIVPVSYATKKFATNYSPNFVFNPMYMLGSDRNWVGFWTGTDLSTGFGHSDLVSFLSATNGLQIQTITDISTDLATLPTWFENSIVDAIGPSGNTEKILRFNYKVKNVPLSSSAPTQSWLLLTRYGTSGNPPPPLNEYYYSVYFKLDPILQTIMKDTATDPSGINWLSIAEMKTGGYGGDASAGDYRYKFYLYTDSLGKFKFQANGDNVANGLGIVPGVDAYNVNNPYWKQETAAGVPKFGVWYKLEIYLKRPSSNTDRSTGITWMAVTPMDTGIRQVVGHKIGGVQMGVQNLPCNRLFLCGMYIQAAPPIVIDTTGLVFYDTFPYNAGVRSINNIMYDIYLG